MANLQSKAHAHHAVLPFLELAEARNFLPPSKCLSLDLLLHSVSSGTRIFLAKKI